MNTTPRVYIPSHADGSRMRRLPSRKRVWVQLDHTLILFGRTVGPRFDFEDEQEARRFCVALGVDPKIIKVEFG